MWNIIIDKNIYYTIKLKNHFCVGTNLYDIYFTKSNRFIIPSILLVILLLVINFSFSEIHERKLRTCFFITNIPIVPNIIYLHMYFSFTIQFNKITLMLLYHIFNYYNIFITLY